MTNPVGYDKDGNPLFGTRNEEREAEQARRAARIEAERVRNRWWKGRMFQAAVALVNRMRMK